MGGSGSRVWLMRASCRSFPLPAYLVLGVVCLLLAAQPPAAGSGPEQPGLSAAASPGATKAGDKSASKDKPGEEPQPRRLKGLTKEEADANSAGCITCHIYQDKAAPHAGDPDAPADEPTLHATGTVILGCLDCHGGDINVTLPAGLDPSDVDNPSYRQAMLSAHVQPTRPEFTSSSANPVRAYTAWLEESRDYIQFVNPGDLRIAYRTCGAVGCHRTELHNVESSLMTHGAMLWGTALYNNGAYPLKNARFGESYDKDGNPRSLVAVPRPTDELTKTKGHLPEITPLARWETSQPGNVLRVFERGGLKKGETGNPTREEEAGRPDVKLSDRGFGTLLRTDPVFLGLQKTRLLDPLLHLPGTNDQPGDYRHSGCSGCHVIYANDRSPVHSGPYAAYGNAGQTQTSDRALKKFKENGERGHPIQHRVTRAIPSSQCMVCHMHPGTSMVTSYFGFTWWDNEVDGKVMYPPEERNPTEQEQYEVYVRNPEAAAARGLWSDLSFLEKTGTQEFNRQLKHTQFADFHGHGWVYRAVFKRDRKGHLLDTKGKPISATSDQLWEATRWKDPVRDNPPEGTPVHMKDIHIQKGMHCADCHFTQDAHGNGNLYGEPRNAVEISCVDCHGSIRARANLRTSAAAAPEPKGKPRGTPLDRLLTPWKERRFYWKGDQLFQRSVVEKGIEWEVVQVADTITPGNRHYNERSHLAKTVRWENPESSSLIWGDLPDPDQDKHSQLAHDDSNMTCFACHTSWTTSCFGCHLSMTANKRMPMQHNEGLLTRNWTSYNFQILRDDVYMLGKDGTVTGNRVAPVRSACAILVSSQSANREWLYHMQQTISSEGFSGHAFSTYTPHTVRGRETKQCTDCHVSRDNNNNAWMAQVLIQGTNFVNFIGRYAYVATGKAGFQAVIVAERDEPAAIIGSDLHRLAYPERYNKHVEEFHGALEEAHHHAGNILDIHQRGEYVYAALGEGGFRAYDIANIDNKNFSERIVTAPVSPFGQRLYVKTKFAQAVATPTTLGVDPLRVRYPENEEQPIHLMFGFLYVADKYEGLVIIGDPDLKTKDPAGPGVGTLLDGDPRNNFLKRALAFNPDGLLNGARRISFAGTYAYVLCDRGLVVVDLDNPLEPKVTAQIGAPQLVEPVGVAVQFRYAFVVDKEGFKVLDITHLGRPRLVEGAFVPLEDAHNVYTARTYAYVAGGKQGLVIVDIERPEKPKLDQVFTGEAHPSPGHAEAGPGGAGHAESKPQHGAGPAAHGSAINDLHDVKIGMVSASVYAFLADGHNGFRVVQLISPEDTPGHYGFSPRPTPKLIATYHTHGPALAVSEGIDRDRAVDESGNQLAVFGRRGARPFTREEAHKMYLRKDQLYTVTDDPPGPPRPHAPHRQKAAGSGGSR